MKPWLGRGLVVLPLVVVPGLVGWRALAHPVDTYGDSGAGYIEHLERVRVLHRFTSSGGSVLDRLQAADGLYPPGLHLLTAPASFVGEHHPAAVAVLGVVWLLLLAAAVGGVARAITPRATVPAAVAALLLPALHAVAPRYYYDLPMTALVWVAAAALAHGHRRPIGHALLAAAAFALACFVKWSALPLGLSVAVAGSLVAARTDRRRAALTLSAFAVASGIFVVPVLLSSSSFGAMGGATFQPPPGVSLPAWSTALDQLRPGLGHALGSMALQARVDGPARAAFYLRRVGTTVFAPVLLPSVVGVTALWARARAPGGWALLLATVPVLAFVLLVVPPLDERFLLTVLPGFAVLAGVALVRPGRIEMIVATASVLLGVLVAVDFHVGPPSQSPDAPETTGHQTPLRWGLSTSIDRRGWARASDLPDHQEKVREALLQVVDDCNATSITGDDALVSDKGDLNWWTFAFERSVLADDAPERVFRPFDSGLGPPPTEPVLAFTRTTDSAPEGFMPFAHHLPVRAWTRPGACVSFR